MLPSLYAFIFSRLMFRFFILNYKDSWERDEGCRRPLCSTVSDTVGLSQSHAMAPQAGPTEESRINAWFNLAFATWCFTGNVFMFFLFHVCPVESQNL